MRRRSLFLEWQSVDDAASRPPFSRREQGLILDHAAPPRVRDVTIVDTDRGPRILPFDAAAFTVFMETLDDFAVIDAVDLGRLDGLIETANAGPPPLPREACVARYMRTGPGPTPGH